MNYTIRVFARPRPRPHAPLYQAAVFDGSRPIATSARYEANAGTGLMAAIREAQVIRDRLLVEDWTRRVQEASAYRPDDFQIIDTEGFTSDSRSRIVSSVRPYFVRPHTSTIREYLAVYAVGLMITIITAVTWSM